MIVSIVFRYRLGEKVVNFDELRQNWYHSGWGFTHYCQSMGVSESSILYFFEKVKSWISWGTSGVNMDVESGKTCWECKMKFTDSCNKYNCQICNGVFCGDCCMQSYGSLDVVASGSQGKVVLMKSCKFCSELRAWNNGVGKYRDKSYPFESPRGSSESTSPNFNSDRFDGYSSHTPVKSSFTTFSSHPSPISLRHSPSRYIVVFVSTLLSM